MAADRADDADRSPADWFVDSFGADYLTLYAHRDAAEAARAVDFATRTLGLTPADRILDLCCGAGRHLTLLAERGLDATGLDLSPTLLRVAARIEPRPSIVRADMRQHPFVRGSFDVVLSFFTSFGYFPEDRENLAVLLECQRVLRDGGRLFLDFLHRDWVLAHGLGDTRDEMAGLIVFQSRRWDRARDRVEKTIRITDADGSRERTYYESVRLYDPEKLAEMITQAGFDVVETFGALDGQPFSGDSKRCIVSARRRNVQ